MDSPQSHLNSELNKNLLFIVISVSNSDVHLYQPTVIVHVRSFTCMLFCRRFPTFVDICKHRCDWPISDTNWRQWMQTGQITLRTPVRSIKNLTNSLLLDVKWVFWSPFQASNMPVHCFSGSLALIGHWYCIIYTVFIVGFSEVFVSDWLKNVFRILGSFDLC